MPTSSKRAARARPPLAQLTPAAWLEALRSDVDDLVAAAEDAIRPLAQRQLGRVEHARIIGESAAALRELMASPPMPS